MQAYRAILSLVFLPALAFAQIPQPAPGDANDTSWIYRVRPELQEAPAQPRPPAETIGEPVTFDNSNSSMRLIRPVAPISEPQPVIAPPEQPPQPADTPAAAEAAPHTPPQPPPPPKAQERPPKPRDAVKWNKRESGNFNVFTQPRSMGVPTPALNMRLESIHQALRRNIPWLMGGKSDVYVYQNRADFLRYEPEAQGWSGAFFSPSDNAIVIYDDPKEFNRIIRQFSHELTHLFFDNS